ncbi:MAG: hypothetical protein H6993_08805 [Pseudomonadales bacterium]|nr:hypothetical protein [Pseudomonadales bacterium]MCP5184047.1 hypothetical protein [Pseudomonadales bacterium]
MTHPGFAWRTRKDGSVQITHHGQLATTLRGDKALAFRQDMANATEDDAQQLMARLTGNYRRGNERTARNHPRNRR